MIRSSLLPMIIIALLLMVFTAGCMPWSAHADYYAQSYELYDDRDGKTVRLTAEHGKKFLIIKLGLEFYGYSCNHQGNIREDFDISLTKQGEFAVYNIYEDESWDFYDAIVPIFREGVYQEGSIFFEIPEGNVGDWNLFIYGFHDWFGFNLLDINISSLNEIYSYPENWDWEEQ